MTITSNLLVVSPLVLILAAGLLSSSILFIANANPLEVEDECSFSYDVGATNGPQNWAKLNGNWTLCGTGSRQSPVDIVQVVSKPSTADLYVQYNSAPAIIKNRGHDIEVKWTEDAGGIILSGSAYKLLQCHWHISSEHAINGTRFDMELHVVHINSQGDIVVVAVMYKLGQDLDPFISKISPYLRLENRKENDLDEVDPRDIKFPSKSEYFRYIGSLTTPPCSENVTWILFKTVKSVSSQQIKTLMEAVHDGSKGNARPLQRLNSRPVYLLRSKSY